MNDEILRKCRGCGIVQNRKNMIKITKVNDKLYINPDSKLTGRSVYVCGKKECIKALIKNKGITKGLKTGNLAQIKEIETFLTNEAQ